MKRLQINPRTLAAFLHDVVAVLLAWLMAYMLRFNLSVPEYLIGTMWASLYWVLPLQISTFFIFGLYKGVWRFASLPDLIRIIKAIGVSAFAIVTIIFMVKPAGVVPRSVLILNPILLLLIMAGSRVLYRIWKEHKLYGHSLVMGKPVLVLGAGEAAIALHKELDRSLDWRVVGFLDDDNDLHGRTLWGVKVLGPIHELSKVAEKLDVENVIVALPSATHQARRRAVDVASQANLTVLTVPSFDDLISGKLSVSQLRYIEVEDLLGRDPVKLDEDGLHTLITEKVVLVSGAGGSIGAELCRQIAKFKPQILLCMDISEFALYTLQQELQLTHSAMNIIYLTGDVKNSTRVDAILKRYEPHIVFHAAAYKHVPMMENENVAEALANNAKGTYILASLCKKYLVEKFVLISTDKAVNPTNVMGASKRLAEMVCQGLQEDIALKPNATKFVMVRFGNVLGSSGSVIPKFRQQIAAGGPVTITHPDITRYFMSIPEATQLVMQAGLMGQGGEVYVLDMGESVKIVDLAKNMIKLSGLQESEIEIKYTGLRPGEKLYEELLADDEHTLPTPHEKLRVAQIKSVDEAWVEALLKWVETTYHLSEAQIKQELKVWVIEYLGDVNAKQASSPSALKLSHSEISTLH
jgi:FlaA1/EpsC-like NDP-sugar epimerase